MVKRLFMVVALGLPFIVVPTAGAQDVKRALEEYTGDWVCQTFAPGYSIVPPHADLSQPQTNRATTPSTVLILKFSLRTDGTYSAPDGKGRYAYNPAANAVTWLDGPHQSTFTQTQLGNRENGAPKMELVYNKRRYGCFISKPRR